MAAKSEVDPWNLLIEALVVLAAICGAFGVMILMMAWYLADDKARPVIQAGFALILTGVIVRWLLKRGR
jgi:H+/Cl- antiporter ClcA